VRLAHGMHLVVVAEGVETEAELDLVRVLGCDKVQDTSMAQQWVRTRPENS